MCLDRRGSVPHSRRHGGSKGSLACHFFFCRSDVRLLAVTKCWRRVGRSILENPSWTVQMSERKFWMAFCKACRAGVEGQDSNVLFSVQHRDRSPSHQPQPLSTGADGFWLMEPFVVHVPSHTPAQKIWSPRSADWEAVILLYTWKAPSPTPCGY